jgi:hypothetical protein
VKDNYNVKLVEFMKYTFDPDILSIFLKEWLDLILASIWSLDEMETVYPAWTTFHTLAVIGLILSRTNLQTPQLTDITTN